MSKIVSCLVVVAVVTIAGLATAEGPKPSPSAQASCVKVFQRQRECTDTFIPALVDLRVSVDKPAGIAARAKKEGREALITVALEEWKSDSTDEAIGQTCTRMASNPQTAAVGTSLEKCAAATACQAFVDCVIPLMGPTLRK